MRSFLEEFGLGRFDAARDPPLVDARCGRRSPVLHVTELGEPGFAGVAFRAASVGGPGALGRRPRAPR